MPNFRWEGIDLSNKRRVSGQIFAANTREVRYELRARRVRPTKIKKPTIFEADLGEILVDSGIAKPFTQKELHGFSKKLSILNNAGVPILESLEILYKQEKNRSFKRVIKQIATDVGGGRSLFEALSRQPGFDKLYCNLVKAGESGGILDEILIKINQFMERREIVKKKVKSALTYPAIVIVVAIGVVGFLLAFVVPKIAESYTSQGNTLPALTRIVMASSNFLVNNILYILIAFFVGIFLISAFSRAELTKPIWDRFMMQLPLLGNIVIKGNLATFTRTLATLLGAGVPMLDSLDIAIDTLDNAKMSVDCSRIKYAVIEGKSISHPMMRISYFPEMVAQMVKVGEATGKVDEMLIKVADVFEQEVEETVDAATKLIEPALIVVLGGVVTIILLAMYMPIFDQAANTV